MALRVWLPLNGNLNNIGCSNVTVTNNGATVDANGKIGSCYSFDGTNDMLSFTPNIDGLSQLSIALWVCPTVANPTGAVFSFENNTYWQLTVRGTSIDVRDNSIGVSGTRKTFSIGSFTAGVWVHIVVTYNAGTLKIYRDGIITNTYTVGGTMLNTGITNGRIGSTVQTGYFYNGKINDFRVYDHCLSAAEVKEISQGLVLHYKLDASGGEFANPNLLTGNVNEISAWTADGVTLTKDNNALKVVDNNSGSRRIYNSVSNVWTTSGDKFTVSFDAYAATNGQIIRLSRSIADYAPNITLTTAWQHYSTQITNTASVTNGTLSIQSATSSGTFWIRNVKLEKGIIETRFLLPGETASRIQDSSGYGHNGSIVGSPTLNSDSGRYSSSIYLDTGVNTRITTPSLTLEPHAITLNIWFKSTNTTPTGDYHMVVDSNTNRQWYEMAVHKTGYFRGGLFVNGARKADNGTSTKCLNGSWHMLTLTYDGTNVNRYVDGVMEKATSAAYSSGLSTPTALTLGRDGPSATYAVKEAYLSDFRIYCTALSANDILALYHTSAKIDNLQNIHAFELVENQSAIKITKTGQLKCNELTETTKASLRKDKKAYAVSMIEK